MLTIWDEILESARLVTLPDVYFHLKKVISDPNYTTAKIAEVISYDPAVSLRLIKVVNSAYFGLNKPVNSIDRAITLLGSQNICDLVLAVSLSQSFKGISNEIMDMKSFWRASVVRAISCRELSLQCAMPRKLVDKEHLFLCGLLSDIGHMFIYQSMPDKALLAIKFAEDQGKALYKVERSLLGIDYANIGAALMRRWQLPRSIWEPTEYHVEPELSQDYQIISCLVHIASLISEPLNHHEAIDLALTQVAPIAWQVTGLNSESCQLITSRVEEQVYDVMQMIFPSLQAA